MTNPQPNQPICKTCAGHGRIKWSHTPGTYECKNCHGTGMQPACPTCGGTRWLPRAETLDLGQPTPERGNCPTCSGTGKQPEAGRYMLWPDVPPVGVSVSGSGAEDVNPNGSKSDSEQQPTAALSPQPEANVVDFPNKSPIPREATQNSNPSPIGGSWKLKDIDPATLSNELMGGASASAEAGRSARIAATDSSTSEREKLLIILDDLSVLSASAQSRIEIRL